MRFPFSPRRRHRRRGDVLRDAGHWPKAEAAYRAHLVGFPDDAAIHVQLGHALKQQGKISEAADAYGEGARRLGEDADSLTHFADALFTLGRVQEAIEPYRRAYALTPDDRVLRRLTLHADQSDVLETTVLGDGSLVFSVQDLFGYLRAHPTLSGIQRAQAAIILHAIADVGADTHFVLASSISRPDILLPGEYWRVDETMLRMIVRHASADPIDHRGLQILLTLCEAGATRIRPIAGSTIVVLGAFWSYGNTVDRFLASQRSGVRLGFYVYDLIPSTHPAYCDAGLVGAFSKALSEMVAVADFILTISDFTRNSLFAHLAATSARALPIVTVPLARCAPGGSGEMRRLTVFDDIGDRPYVAYVSTVEGRKNHLYVVRAWQQLMAEGVDVPDLLFVGRLGWQIAALDQALRSTSWLGDRVRHVEDLTDGELNTIYAGSLFTVFTSFAEGWGLPVGESLSHGRPCVASNVSSIPEVGGDLVDYVDPADLSDGIAVLRKMVLDSAYRAERSALIERHFVERSWDDVGRDFIAAVRSLAKGKLSPHPLPNLPEARPIGLDEASVNQSALQDEAACPIGLLFDSFYPPRGDGMWMRGSRGRLRLAEGLTPGEPFAIELRLILAPWAVDGRISISSDPRNADCTLLLSVDDIDLSKPVTWKTCVDASGILAIDVAWDGLVTGPPDDPRRFAIGLSGIAYVRGEDVGRLSAILSSPAADS